ncbi:MAG TPA: hypothetical protein VNQ73_19715 [Ilumatobacter sp.]|nr:hypothetical protein [Ilumatobacter sp.]
MNDVVNFADVGVVGTVTALQPQQGRDGEPIQSHVVVGLEIDRALFGEPGAHPIVVVLPPIPDSHVDGLPVEVPTEFRYGPDLKVGDRILALLGVRVIATREGPQTVLLPQGGYQGIWTIDGDSAVSVDPLRTVPVDRLVAHVLEDREIGFLNSDSPSELRERNANSGRNPLGDPDISLA